MTIRTKRTIANHNKKSTLVNQIHELSGDLLVFKTAAQQMAVQLKQSPKHRMEKTNEILEGYLVDAQREVGKDVKCYLGVINDEWECDTHCPFDKEDSNIDGSI